MKARLLALRGAAWNIDLGKLLWRKKLYEDICKSASLGTLRKPFIAWLEGLSTRLYLRFQVSRFVFR